MTMEKKIPTGREIRQSRFLLRAPLLGLPLLTMLFWIFGGGRTEASAAGRPLVKGFDMRLPGPRMDKRSELNKMDYYAQAERDSVEQLQKRKMEENYARQLGLGDSLAERPVSSGHSAALLRRGVPVDPVVRKVEQQLEVLDRTLASAGSRRALASDGHASIPEGRAAEMSPAVLARVTAREADIEKLERMMGVLKNPAGGDEELRQLTGVLDRLAAVNGRASDSSPVHAGGSAPMTTQRPGALPAPRLQLSVKAVPDGEDTTAFDSSAIVAVVPEEQSLVTGEQLRLELARDVKVGDRLIPRGTFMTGVASLSGERLRVTIAAIGWEEHIFPVGLQVYDEDGGMGIYIPGAPAQDALRESGGQEVNSFGPTVLSTTLTGQAAGAGMQMARGLLSRKIRPVRVTVPEGYRVLLHVQNSGI